MEYNFLELADKYYDDALADLKKLISCKSVLDVYKPKSAYPFGMGCKEALDTMLSFAQRDGFKYINDDYFAGMIEYGEGEEIAILGHLDVVPADGDWKTDPFEAVEANGNLYGRGTTDDKGPVIASYYAVKMLKDLGIKFNKKVQIIVGCDEESGSRCLKHYFSNHKKPQMGFSPDADFPLIYGEKAFASFDILGNVNHDSIIDTWKSGTRSNIVPDTCKVTLKGNYKEEFNKFLTDNNISGKIDGDTYITYGKAAHGSMPELGINANFSMARFVDSIHSDNFTKFILDCLLDDPYGKRMEIDAENGDMGRLSLNPGVFDVENNECHIEIDCRTPKESCEKVIDVYVKECANKHNLIYKPTHREAIHYVDPNSNLVQSLYKAYKEIALDEVNKPMTIGGGTYAKFIDNCVAFGPTFPGEDNLIHSPNEFINLENFKKDIAIYAYAIYELVK